MSSYALLKGAHELLRDGEREDELGPNDDKFGPEPSEEPPRPFFLDELTDQAHPAFVSGPTALDASLDDVQWGSDRDGRQRAAHRRH